MARCQSDGGRYVVYGHRDEAGRSHGLVGRLDANGGGQVVCLNPGFCHFLRPGRTQEMLQGIEQAFADDGI